MSMVKVNHPVAGEMLVPLEIFKDSEKYNQFLLENTADKNYSTSEVMGRQFERGFTDSASGIADFFADPSERTEGDVATRYLDEFESRLEREQNPVAAWSALIAGSIADPVALPVTLLKPLKIASTVGTYAIHGAAQGAFGGFVGETYEEFGDSRAENVAAGALFGAGIGTAIGGVVKKLSRNEANAEALANISTDAEKAIDEVAADIAKAEQKDVAIVKKEIEDSDDLLPDFLPQKEARQLSIWETRSELEKDIPFLMTKAEEAKTRGQVTIADQQLATKQAEVDNLRKAMSGRQGQARKRVESMYDRAAAELEQARTYRDELSNKIDRHVKAIKSEADIAALNKGEIPKHLKKRIDADVKANEEARARYKDKVKQQRLIKESETPAEKVNTTQAKQEAEIQRQQKVVEAEQQGLPTGLDTPQTSASAAATRPSAIYNPEATEGVDVDALTKAETTTKLKDIDPLPDRGLGRTENERRRAAKRKEASSEQLADMLPVSGGKYTRDAVADAAERLKTDIGNEQDYDTLIDYLEARLAEVKTGRSSFSSIERQMLEPVFAEAQKRLLLVGKELRSLIRRNELDSLRGVELVQDLQFYNYIADIELTMAAEASANLRQLKHIKDLRKSHAGQIKAGKPVKNAFASLDGRSLC